MILLKKKVNEKFSKAQTNKPCTITGCENGGRTIGVLGRGSSNPIELNYCGRHRKYGERVMNFFIGAIFGDELTNMLQESKKDLFQENFPEFCESCNDKIASYVHRNISKLEEIKKWEKKMK